MFRMIEPYEKGLVDLLKKGRLCWRDPMGTPPPADNLDNHYYRYVGLHRARQDLDEKTLSRWALAGELYEYMKAEVKTGVM